MEMDKVDMTCSICMELFVLPCSLECGHNFCKMCLESVSNRKCPLCRKKFSNDVEFNRLLHQLLLSTNSNEYKEKVKRVEKRYQIAQYVENHKDSTKYKTTLNLIKQKIKACRMIQWNELKTEFKDYQELFLLVCLKEMYQECDVWIVNDYIIWEGAMSEYFQKFKSTLSPNTVLHLALCYLRDLEDSDDDEEDFSIPKQMFINKETFGEKLYIITNNYENEFLDYVATVINDAEDDAPAPSTSVSASAVSVGYSVSAPAPASAPTNAYSFGLYNESLEGSSSDDENVNEDEDSPEDEENNTSTSSDVDEFNLSF
jgi:hypothetical protein